MSPKQYLDLLENCMDDLDQLRDHMKYAIDECYFDDRFNNIQHPGWPEIKEKFDITEFNTIQKHINSAVEKMNLILKELEC